MRKAFLLIVMFMVGVFAHGQMVDPVHASAQLKTDGSATGEIVFSLKIDAGWHVYSYNLGSDGPIQASFNAHKMDGIEPVGRLTHRGNEISKFDPMFGMKLRYFENSVQFVQKVKFTKPEYKLDASLEYGSCNDESCLPPQEVSITKAGKSPAVDAKAATEAQKTVEMTAEEAAKLKADSIKLAADT
ncbi:MAG TPA: protein-disulfide reductase DsbD domain-containing protein, partial [Prevotella sp.]